MDNSKRQLQQRVVEFYRKRVEEYEHLVRLHRHQASQDEQIAANAERERLHTEHIKEENDLADRRNGRSSSYVSQVAHLISTNSSLEWETSHRTSAFLNMSKARFFEEAAKDARTELTKYQQRDAESFTKGLVEQLLSEPLREYSDKGSSVSKDAPSGSLLGKVALGALGLAAGMFLNSVLSSDKNKQ